ncbi:MAG TPA: hypothetical protein VKF16_00550 [Candidatus Dormibacteraeota bacterium]|nr:hypothetical protein [Candidatus Dormibacteraeota bacterium]
MPEAAVHSFGPQTKIREVINALGESGRELLKKHGYDLGEGFVDVLSQYQTLEHASRTERLRDLDGLLRELNAGA